MYLEVSAGSGGNHWIWWVTLFGDISREVASTLTATAGRIGRSESSSLLH
jgi:hypothetical protein